MIGWLRRDKNKLEKERVIGDRAKRLLDDDLIQDAFTSIENNLLQQFKSGSHNDVQGLVHLKMLYTNFLAFKSIFENAVVTGEMAKKELESLEKQPPPKRR